MRKGHNHYTVYQNMSISKSFIAKSIEISTLANEIQPNPLLRLSSIMFTNEEEKKLNKHSHVLNRYSGTQ